MTDSEKIEPDRFLFKSVKDQKQLVKDSLLIFKTKNQDSGKYTYDGYPINETYLMHYIVDYHNKIQRKLIKPKLDNGEISSKKYH